MPSTTNLKPCPHCGSIDTHVLTHRDRTKSVACRLCGADGPPAATVKKAKEGWNRRYLEKPSSKETLKEELIARIVRLVRDWKDNTVLERESQIQVELIELYEKLDGKTR